MSIDQPTRLEKAALWIGVLGVSTAIALKAQEPTRNYQSIPSPAVHEERQAPKPTPFPFSLAYTMARPSPRQGLPDFDEVYSRDDSDIDRRDLETPGNVNTTLDKRTRWAPLYQS